MRQSGLINLNLVSLVLQQLGADTPARAAALLAGSGLQLDDLEQPQRLITLAQEQRVIANALPVAPPELGLLLGWRLRVSGYGLLGYALLSAPTLGAALQAALAHQGLLGAYFTLRLERHGEWVWLRADDHPFAPELERCNAECCLASLRAICCDLVGAPLPLTQVAFRHPAPAYRERYGDCFGRAPLAFEAPFNGLAFPATWLGHGLPLADAVTHRDALQQCERLAPEQDRQRALLARIRTLLSAELAAPPSFEALARRLGMAPRSLRRHLQAAGSGYQQLLDELRFARARDLLAQERLPIYRIAEVMGFSETASFRHAFRRWSGQSPRDYRL
ncbi:MAG: AraC family transcriptional regulator [Pseudomonas oryzihabitans]